MTQTSTSTPRQKTASFVLEALNVTKTYPGVTALENVELQVVGGEVHGIVGENGAGKSTLMGVVSGAVLPDTGTVRIAGAALSPFTTGVSRSLGLSIVRQEPALLPDLTVAENLYLGMPEKFRPAVSRISPWAAEILARWDEGFVLDPLTRVEQLLPEQRFIVEICRALASQPTVLVLDEPTEHLAAADVEKLFEHIRRVAATGTAVIYISHRIPEVKAISDRISVLRNGRSQGTYDASTLSEAGIVNLIVGRVLEATFPDKSPVAAAAEPRLKVERLQGRRFTGIDLSVAPGEILGLAGIEGNGQRDFLRALAGIDGSSGRILVDGAPASTKDTEQSARSGIAYIAPDRHREGVFAGLSVRENVAARNLHRFARAGFLSSSSEESSVRNLSEKFGVKTPHLEADIASLSGGNQQKAVLAGAFASEPRILLLDEPTQGVDVGARSEIYSLIRERAHDTGMATVVLSSDAMELAGLCDRVVVFSRGHVITEFTGDHVTEERITDAALQATAVREKTQNKRNNIVEWLAGDWAPVALVGTALVALGIVAQSMNPLFFSELSIASLLTLATTLVFAALAQNLVLLVGGIDLSIGPFMGFLVVVLSFFLVDGTPAGLQLVGWLLVLVIPLALGLVNWALSDVAKIHPMIATLVTYMALQAASLILRPVPGGVISRGIIEPLGARVGPIPVLFIVAVLLSAGMAWWLQRSRAGMALRAVGSRPQVAAVNGLRPSKARIFAYVGASFLAALGGITLMVQLGSGDPTAGTSYTLSSISAAVIGGASLLGARGSFLGALLGALLIQTAMSVTTFMGLDSAWQSFLLGGLTIIAVAGYSRSRQLVKVEAH
jgi:ribose transport system ATP-binding protein